MRFNSSIKDWSTKDIKFLVRAIINWCIDHLGENTRISHKNLRIELDFNEEESDYGEYDRDEEDRIIKIYMARNKTIKDMVGSGLHEYVHDLQPYHVYDKLTEKYGYYNNPQEKEARKIAERFTRICWEDIKYKVKEKCKKK